MGSTLASLRGLVPSQRPAPAPPAAAREAESAPALAATQPEREYPPHQRVLTWPGLTALAMGGSNQSLFLLTALVATQGSAAIPLLCVGLLLSWAAAPGWTELSLLYPGRVGGIAATCVEAFRPYSPVLANLTGVCYWWGWVPTCGVTAFLASTALHQAYLPGVPVALLASLLVMGFAALNLVGVRVASTAAKLIAVGAGGLAAASMLIPMLSGTLSWQQSFAWHLRMPFDGVFGSVTSAMAGLYLIGFAAPAFEAALCHVGETCDPGRQVPRAVLASGALASVFFIGLPLVWLGVFGENGLDGSHGADLAQLLGPTFAPVFGAMGKGLGVWLMVLGMFHGTLQPLAGASRALSQCSEDGLLPRMLARRNRHGAPWVATLLTMVAAMSCLLLSDPGWLIAAANFTYLISIGLPSVAVWLLRRHEPGLTRLYRAPRGTIGLGLVAAGGWLASMLLGFEQFHLGTVLLGLVLAYSGSVAYAWRVRADAKARGERASIRSLHVKLTGAMVSVLSLDAIGYYVAVSHVSAGQTLLVTVLEDLFVAVALLTVSVGLILPGMIAHGATQVASAATRLAHGTMADLTHAMRMLGKGELDAAQVRVDVAPVSVRAQDEVGVMAAAFNQLQVEVARAAGSLDSAREQLRSSRDHLQHLATHDALTELPNRRAMEAALEGLVLRVEQGAGAGAVAVIDLDGFKYINDSKGHPVGDAVLVHAASILRAALPEPQVLGRLGGDEFAVLFLGASAREAEEVLGGMLRMLRETPVSIGAHLVRVTGSAGLATFEAGERLDAAELLVSADVALYDAKEAGRDRVALASASRPEQTELRERHTWLARVQDALNEDRLTLLAQPIVDLATGAVTRHELLLRMVNPDGTLIPPGSFLPMLERAGLIGSIDRWVLARTFAMQRQAQALGQFPHYCVNLSGASMGDPEVLSLIEEGLKSLPRSREVLIIEVTETSAVVDMEQARLFALRLKSLGVGLALDDFGSGYGSFAYLKQLPFDVLKIDGEFVRGLVGSLEDQAVVTALVTIAASLHKETVAEFVEDAATLCLLRELGVTSAQGYFVGRPAPVKL